MYTLHVHVHVHHILSQHILILRLYHEFKHTCTLHVHVHVSSKNVTQKASEQGWETNIGPKIKQTTSM